MNHAALVGIVERVGQVPRDAGRLARLDRAANRVEVRTARGGFGFAACGEDGWEPDEGILAEEIISWRPCQPGPPPAAEHTQ